MRLLLFFPVSFVLSVISYGQEKGVKSNVSNLHSPKQGYCVHYGKDRPGSGIPPDGKVEEGRYVNDRKEGTWIKYHKDGKTPKIIGNYKNNRPSGPFQKFDECGQLIEKGNFTKNVYCDSVIRWHANGQLKYVAFYNDKGREEGQVTAYYENGCLEWSYFAVDGLIKDFVHLSENGDTIPYRSKCEFSTQCMWSYSQKPTIKEVSVCTNAKKRDQKPPFVDPSVLNIEQKTISPNGFNSVLNADKEKWQEGIFKDGQLWDGKVYIYDRDGILLKVEVYKHGLYHSDGSF